MKRNEKLMFIKHLVKIGEIESAKIACYDWGISVSIVEKLIQQV